MYKDYIRAPNFKFPAQNVKFSAPNKIAKNIKISKIIMYSLKKALLDTTIYLVKFGAE